MPKENGLALRFDPRTIEHLGIKMYSRLPQALAELVANGYDAGASQVEIKLYDNDPNNKRIVVADNGFGMSFDDVRDKFLVIGRKRRDSDKSRKIKIKKSDGRVIERIITGSKGLGKLALFGIGNNIKIETAVAGEGQLTDFSLNWNDILAETSGEYAPITISVAKPESEHGTTITLSELTREPSFDLEENAVALSKMFNCIDTIDADFKVFFSKNDDPSTRMELTRDLRYKDVDIEFEWDIAKDVIPNIDSKYARKNELTGIIKSSLGKTMKTDLRGVAVYANGRLASVPDFFGAAAASYAHAYLSGWIDADFIDESNNEVISTDRQSISWDMPETIELKAFLKKIVVYVASEWERKRKEKKKDKIKSDIKVDIESWSENVSYREDIKDNISSIIKTVLDNPEIDTEKSNKLLSAVHAIAPEQADYYWRNLNANLQTITKKDYDDGDYYEAIRKAVITYINAITARMTAEGKTVPDRERGIFEQAFGQGQNAHYKVVSHFKKPDGTPFSASTVNALEDAQKELSQGILSGYRHPLSHDLAVDIKTSGIITEQNCLDALSLLTMLLDRFENVPAGTMPPATNTTP